ncbi:MAG: hypothetical protein K8H86_08625, partial [Ignavibacteriaceae bacterium]|nr:hypothetical protein [Ignavibacteriaceae bacterium]
MKKQTIQPGQVIIRTATEKGLRRFEIKKFPVYFGTEASPDTIQLPPKLAKNKHGKLDFKDGRLVYEEIGRFATKINDVIITQTINYLRPGTNTLMVGKAKVIIENELAPVIEKKRFPSGVLKYALYGTGGIALLGIIAFLLIYFLKTNEYELTDFNISPASVYYKNSIDNFKFEPELSLLKLVTANTEYTLYFDTKDSIVLKGDKINNFELPNKLISDKDLKKNLDITLKINNPEINITNSKTKTFTIYNSKRRFEKDGVTL